MPQGRSWIGSQISAAPVELPPEDEEPDEDPSPLELDDPEVVGSTGDPVAENPSLLAGDEEELVPVPTPSSGGQAASRRMTGMSLCMVEVT